MADVYLAVSRVTPGFERLAVIKRLRADLLVEDEENPQDAAHFIAMFRDEARLAMLLKHGNIVHTYDVFEDNDKLYLVMEYLEGHSLATVQRELAKTGRKLPVDLAAVVVSELLNGLHYAHELQDYGGQPLNIVHRDVSPQNVLLGYEGTIKLFDFGVAKASFRSTQTRAGTMKGKARYMAPEQVMSKEVDRRADVYSAGVMLWELVSGRKLVNGANMFEQLVNVLKTPPPPLSTIIPDIDPALDAIVAKALEREPADRFETAAAMREALLAFVSRTSTARAEDLGVLVSEVFQKQRAHVASVIRTRMAAEGPGAASAIDESEADVIFVELDEERGLASGVGGSVSGSRSVNSTSTASVVSSGIGIGSTQVSGVVPQLLPSSVMTAPPAPEKQRKPAAAPFVIGAVALIVIAAFVFGRSMQQKNPAVAATPSATGAGVLAPSLPSSGVTGAATTAAPVVVAAPPAPREPPVTAETAPTLRPAPVGAAPRPVVAWAPAPHVAPRPAAPKDDSPAATTAPAAAAGGASNDAPGFLTMDTYPWTKVSVDGKPVGSTPLVRISLSPGPHSVSMENPGENVHQATTVVIKSGETVSKRLAFDPK